MSHNNLPVKPNTTAVSSVPANGNPTSSASGIMKARSLALKPTQYSARVTRDNPCAVVILIDQSYSMTTEITTGYGVTQMMSEAVADIVNELFDSLLMKCQKDSVIRDYFNFLIIGYGQDDSESNVSVIWEGSLKGKDWVTVSDLKNNILRIDKFQKKETMPWGEVIEGISTKKVWVNPSAEGGSTPMGAALKFCKEKVQLWVTENQESFPPMIFNITDGYPTDIQNSDLVNICKDIKSITTLDGNSLLFNCLLTDSEGKELLLPSEHELSLISDEPYHLALFEASSFLPDELKRAAYQIYNNDKYLKENIKGVILNTSLSSIGRILNIGTNTALSKAND